MILIRAIMRRRFFIILLITLNVFHMELHAQDYPSPTTLAVAWNSDGTKFAIGGTESVKIIDSQTGSVLHELTGQMPIYAIAWSPDDTRLATSDNSNTISIWDTQSGNLLVNFGSLHSYASTLAWHPDGTRLVSAEPLGIENPSIRIWDTTTYQEVDNLQAGQIFSIEWTPDGTQIVATHRQRGLMIYGNQLPERNRDSLRMGPDDTSSRSSVSPSGQYVAIAVVSGDIYLWDIIADSQVGILSGHTDWVTGLDWSPDGTQIVSISLDQTMKIWDAASLQVIETVSLNANPYSVDWHPSQAKVIYGGETIVYDIVDTTSCDTHVVTGDTTDITSCSDE